MNTVVVDAAADDFHALARHIRAAGLLEHRRGYYGAKIALTVALYAAGWAALAVVGDSWTALGIAAFLGAMFTQLGFLGHDAGHQQVFRSHRANRLLGLVVGDTLIGLSFGWWVSKHNAHHAHPNEIDRDPDIAAGLVAFGDVNDHAEDPGMRSWLLARCEFPLFLLLMLLRSAGLHVSGIQALIRKRDRGAAIEGSLIAAHVGLYLTVVLWVLSPGKALAFIAVQQGCFSLYLGCSFAPNHKGMPILTDDMEMSFARRQVITARNVTGGWFTNLMLGGLNYQIEHHLFPSMPRPNLARAQSVVRAFCLESGLGYCEDSLIGSLHRAIRRADAAAATATVP